MSFIYNTDFYILVLTSSWDTPLPDILVKIWGVKYGYSKKNAYSETSVFVYYCRGLNKYLESCIHNHSTVQNNFII